jgi:2-haloacid dehalogenase
MSSLRPKYISFDCYGTLINFQMAELARELFADRIAPENMAQFTTDFARYRLDEVMGDWRPYDQLLCNSVERTCKRWGIEYRDNEGLKFYKAVPTWQPHPDVPAALARLATEYKLVILSNAMDEQIMASVDKLGAPFHRVYTAQQAQAYKPRLQAFEYMIEQLGCNPEDILHVSSSMTARRRTMARITFFCDQPDRRSACSSPISVLRIRVPSGSLRASQRGPARSTAATISSSRIV